MKHFLLLLLALPGLLAFHPNFFNKSELSGLVQDKNSLKALAGVTVTIKKDHKTEATAVTDEKGAFTVELEPGNYEVICVLKGYETVRTIDVLITKNKMSRLHCELQPSADLEAETTVNYIEPAAPYTPPMSTGPATISISPEITMKDTLMADGAKSIVSGHVIDDSGEAVIGASVRLIRETELIGGGITDVNGNFRVLAEPGSYQVEINSVGYSSVKIPVIELLKNKVAGVGTVTMPEGAVLSEVAISVKREEMIWTRDETISYSVTAPASGADKAKETPKRRAAKTTARGEAEKKPAPGLKLGKPVDAEMDRPVTVETVFDDKTKDVSGAGPTTPDPKAGLLTAGEWNDLHNWNKHWRDLLSDGEIAEYERMYKFYPKYRYTVYVRNEQGYPLVDVPVVLKYAGKEILWEARTDNTGKAELWVGMFNDKTAGQQDMTVEDFFNQTDQQYKTEPLGEKPLEKLSVEATLKGQTLTIKNPKKAEEGFTNFKFQADCGSPKGVDIVWAVDATGSMGDEIEYLKTELLDVIGRAQSNNPDLKFRMGTVFYRDQGDEYLTKRSVLSSNISRTVDFIKEQYAGGGGDYPEAVHTALEEAIFNQQWDDNAVARICFLVLDASPHQSPEVNASLERSIREAARRGIRIVPVTASGIQKDTEFLMKFFGLSTNGSYVFLTDHSGIGGKHIEPTTDEYKVELLNDLLVRLITEYTTVPTCEGQSVIRFEGQPQQNEPDWKALYYPNPASSQFTLELPFDVESVVIYNAEGMAVRKIEKPQAGKNNVSVNDLSEGFYTIRILKEGRMQSGKLMVVRAN